MFCSLVVFSAVSHQLCLSMMPVYDSPDSEGCDDDALEYQYQPHQEVPAGSQQLVKLLRQPNYRQICQQFPLTCPHCGMTFIHQIHLCAHVRIHWPSKEVKCSDCNVTCPDNISLQDHIDEMHSPARAFSVKYSIAERISYGPPDSQIQFNAQYPTMPPCNANTTNDPELEAFGHQSAFGEGFCVQMNTPTSSGIPTSSGEHEESSPKRKRRLTTLERLLMRPSATPSLTSELPDIVVVQPPDEDIDVLSVPSSPTSESLSPLNELRAAAAASSTAAAAIASASPMHSSTHPDDVACAESGSLEDCGKASGSAVGKNVTCEHCGKRFLYKCNLARHLSAIHNERTIKIDGPTAGRSPRSPFKVGPMECIPTEKKEIVLLRCEFCDRSFTQKSSLVLHQQVHQGPEPYRCSICHGLRFSTRAQMESHMRRHRMRGKTRRQSASSKSKK